MLLNLSESAVQVIINDYENKLEDLNDRINEKEKIIDCLRVRINEKEKIIDSLMVQLPQRQDLLTGKILSLEDLSDIFRTYHGGTIGYGINSKNLKIHCIKKVRELTGCLLKEAKDVVEGYRVIGEYPKV